jgi:hypothetical protein
MTDFPFSAHNISTALHFLPWRQGSQQAVHGVRHFPFKLFIFFFKFFLDLSEDAAPAVSVESPFVTVFTAPEKMLLPL